jgi:hypothetical protein
VAVTVADLNEKCPTSTAETLYLVFPTTWPPMLPGQPRFLITSASDSHVTRLATAKSWIRPFLRLLINATARTFTPLNETDCFVPPSDHFMGHFNFEAPWPIQCTFCAVVDELPKSTIRADDNLDAIPIPPIRQEGTA